MRAKELPPLDFLRDMYEYTEESFTEGSRTYIGGFIVRPGRDKYIHYKTLRRQQDSGIAFVGSYTSHKKSGVEYAIMNTQAHGAFLTHRLVWLWHNGVLTPEQEIDHRDRNTFHNCIANLREASDGANHLNRSSYVGSSSRFVGVSFRKNCVDRQWAASYRHDGVSRYLGVFATEEEAAIARDDAVFAHYGIFANLNFPDRYVRECD